MQVVTTLMLVHDAVGHLHPVVVVETVGTQDLSITQSWTVLVTAHGSGQGPVEVDEHDFVTVAVIVPVRVIVAVTGTVTVW